MPKQILQISDTHLFADRDQVLLGVPTYASLQLVVADVRQRFSSADACLLTGDLSHDGSAESYRHLLETLTPLTMPMYALPGNHDATQLMCSELERGGISCAEEYECGGWSVILLNSVASDGKHHGDLTGKQLEHLDGALKEKKDRPCLIAVHHPVVPLGSAWIDTLGLRNNKEFFTVIDRHPQVRAIIWGHAHQEYVEQHGDVALLGVPSTCVQFRPRVEDFDVDHLHPGYRVITLQDDGDFETQICRIDTFPFEVDEQKNGYA